MIGWKPDTPLLDPESSGADQGYGTNSGLSSERISDTGNEQSDRESGNKASSIRKSILGRTRDAAESSWRPLLVVIILFIAWDIVARENLVAGFLLPAPGRVWNALLSSSSYLWKNTLITLYETVLGFAVATIVGIISAAAIVSSKNTEKTLYPLLIFAQVIPKVAIAPLFVVWLGFGTSPKVLVAVLVAFFPVVVSSVSGFRSVNPDLLNLAAIMGSSKWKTFWKIRFPNALPHIFSGLKVAGTLAVVGAVVGEFVGANSGIGYVLLTANGNLDTPILYAGLFILSLIGAVVFLAVALLEHIFVPWQPSRRQPLGVSTY